MQIAKRWRWFGILVILLIFVLRVYSLQPQHFFDFYQDDAIYFTTAKALANGEGYIIPSFPGVLPQTKYPVLYPLLLSAVWRLDPAFPHNLRLGIIISLAIAAAYVGLGYVVLRRLGASYITTLGVSVAVALHPVLCFFAGNLLSDYLFAALILAGAIAADNMCSDTALSERHRVRWGMAAGITLGFAVLARSAAFGAIAGTLFYGARRRQWRPLAACIAVSAAIVSIAAITTRITEPKYVPAGVGNPPIGFQHVLVYYSSYVRMWRLSVPSASVFLSMISKNLRRFLLAPGNYLIMMGSSLPDGLTTKALALLVSAASVGGILRWSSSSRRHAILYIFLGTAPIFVLWNYALYERFLLPFVPLIFFGIVIEMKRVLLQLASASKSAEKTSRFAAIPIALTLLALLLLSLYNYWHLGRNMREFSENRSALNRERREAYDWLSQNTPQSARVIAYEDGLVYLYTGRQAIRPVDISTDCYYEPERPRCESDFSEMGTWVGYAGINYWLTDPFDLQLEGQRQFRPDVQEYIARLKARMHPVFVSSGGKVTVYDTTCLVSNQAPGCGVQGTQSAARHEQGSPQS